MADLPALFSKALQFYDDVENFQESRSSENFNLLVHNACSTCSLAMKIISDLDLFSKNETLDDLTSNEIKYLVTPALLGYFLGHRNDDRKKCIEMALSSYENFMDLCSSYGLYKPLKATGNSATGDTSVTPAASAREAKIKRYKEKKALQEKLKSLTTAVEHPNVDEDVKRDYHITLVRYWLYMMEDERQSLLQERTLLSIQPEELADMEKEESTPKVPLQPFIITRDAAQAAVFGAGYPSLPTMSLDHFFDEQVKRRIFPAPRPLAPTSQTGPSFRRIDPSDANRAAEEEKAAKEDQLEDADDPERLHRARNFDEFKDTHRRGCGHRINQG